jgi:hypothetical protein
VKETPWRNDLPSWSQKWTDAILVSNDGYWVGKRVAVFVFAWQSAENIHLHVFDRCEISKNEFLEVGMGKVKCTLER